MKTVFKITASLLLAVSVVACQPTKHPEVTTVGSAMQERLGQQPVAASNLPRLPEKRNPGSLWLSGNSAFFKDNRAQKVGDIVTVIVEERASAEVEANTDATRQSTKTSGLSNLLNMEGWLTNRGIPPGPASLLDMESNRDFQGEGATDREDILSARIAAVVTQVLPNDYLVIEGSREVMVNYEKQIMRISGVIRQGDISSDNTIASEKIAEARISYAGHGMVDQSQSPQYGEKFLDKWLPF